MKLLDNATLNEVSNIVASHANDCSIDLKLESYSIKMVSTDKKSWKKNMSNPASEFQPISVPEDTFSSSLTLSPMSTLTKRFRHYSERSLSGSDNDTADENITRNLAGTVSRKTLFNLTAALNIAFPDYDFSYRTASSFLYYPNFEQVKEMVDKHLNATVDSYNQLQYNLWGAIEDEICPSKCNIYSYITSNESDPFNEDGVMWSLNFLFFNKTLRRILLFSVRAIHVRTSSEEEGEDIEYVIDYQD